MAAPFVLSYEGAARAVDIVAGATVAVSALVNISTAARALRWLSAGVAVGLLMAPWYLGAQNAAAAQRFFAAVLILCAALVRGNDPRPQHST